MTKPILTTAAAILACATFSSCTTSSISNVGSWGQASGHNSFYQGEINELDVLGVPKGEISESAIASALGNFEGSRLTIPSGARIMLVQSGAVHPDPELQSAMAKHYEIVPFSGIPSTVKEDQYSQPKPEAEAKRLRYAAAKAGVRYVVVVWGTIDTTEDEMATGAISWVPMAGRVVADEKRASRIVTTAAVIETGTGTWRSISTEPVVRKTVSSYISRDSRWTQQVEALKEESYRSLAKEVSSL